MLASLHNRFVAEQDQRRKGGKGGDQTAQDTFRKDDAEVSADLEPHEDEHQQAHNRGQSAAQDGGRGAADRGNHGLFLFQVLSLLPVAVQQDDGIVHRQDQLQHGCKRMGNQSHAGQQRVGSHIDHDGEDQRQQDQERLDQRMAHQEEDQQSGDDTGRHHHHDVVGHSGVVFHFHFDAVAEAVLDAFLDGLPIHFGREHVMVERVRPILPDIELARALQHLPQCVIQGVGRRLRDKHDAECLHTDVHLGEVLLQEGYAMPHRRIVRQVAGHVCVDARTRNQQHRNECRRCRQCQQRIPPSNQEAGLVAHSALGLRTRLGMLSGRTMESSMNPA